MEFLSFEATAAVLNITPERLGELVRAGRVEHIRNRSRVEFAWGHIERLIQQETGVGVFAAQRQIADKIWPNKGCMPNTEENNNA